MQLSKVLVELLVLGYIIFSIWQSIKGSYFWQYSKEAADKEKVLMYFYQTNTDDPKTSGRTGDKAIIGSISKDPLSVYVIPEVAHQKIRYVLDDKTHNPLHTDFVVDVNVEKDRKGMPKVYRVMRLHDVIYDDDDGDA